MHGEGGPPSGRCCFPEGIPVDHERSIDVPTALAEPFDSDLHLDLRSWHFGADLLSLLSADNPERDIVINDYLGVQWCGQAGSRIPHPSDIAHSSSKWRAHVASMWPAAGSEVLRA